MASDSTRIAATAAAAILSAVFVVSRLARRMRRRDRRLGHAEERVLIIGASSGVGRALAKRYAARGARVCAVARRADQMASLAAECGDRCIGRVADFSKPEDMVALRDFLLAEWGGLDTIHISAGVSALRPIMQLTGVETASEDASLAGIRNAVDISGKAVQGNFTGPLVSALTFIPTLIRTSPCPSILLVSSVAALIPPPTRALYGSTKASSLLLFQAIAIEHPEIAFTNLIPATIEGDFRASAVDSGPVREANPNKHGLKLDYVAKRCVAAVDEAARGNVIVPWIPYGFGHILYWFWPSFVERQARRKYNYP